MISEWVSPMHFLCAASAVCFLFTVWDRIDKVIERKREQPPAGELNVRVAKLEREVDEIRKEFKQGFKDLGDLIALRNSQGEERASKIHSRIDPIAQNTGEIKGQLAAFNESFRNFTQMIKELAKGERTR